MTVTRRHLRRPLLACSIVLCLGATPDTMRDLLPPSAPKFVPHPDAVFADDFHTGKLDGWRPDREGVWSVRRRMLVAQLPDAKQQHSLIYAGDPDWTDYAVDLDVCGIRGVDKGVIVRVNGEKGVGLDLRGPGYQDLKVQISEFPVTRVSIENGNSQWHHLRVEMRGVRLRVIVDGDEVVNRRLPSRAQASGHIALAAYTGGVGQCTVYYDNVVVTPLEASAGGQ